MTDWVSVPESALPINREQFLLLRERVSVLEEIRDELCTRTERLANSFKTAVELLATVQPSVDLGPKLSLLTRLKLRLGRPIF